MFFLQTCEKIKNWLADVAQSSRFILRLDVFLSNSGKMRNDQGNAEIRSGQVHPVVMRLSVRNEKERERERVLLVSQ